MRLGARAYVGYRSPPAPKHFGLPWRFALAGDALFCLPDVSRIEQWLPRPMGADQRSAAPPARRVHRRGYLVEKSAPSWS